ncbi:hypothetical protein OROGR_007324 [Orobanche gracilis]
MASGTLGDSCDELIARARSRWTENSIVYTRRKRQKSPKSTTNDDTPTTTTSITEKATSGYPVLTQTEFSSVITAAAIELSTAVTPQDAAVASPLPPAAGSPAVQDAREAVLTHDKDDNFSPQSQQVQELQHSEDRPSDADENCQNRVLERGPQTMRGSCEKDQIPIGNRAGELGSPQVPQGNDCSVNGNGIVKPLVIFSVDDRIRFSISKVTAKNEIKDFKRTLLHELNQVTRLYKQLEAKELQIVPYNSQINNSYFSNSSNYISANGANVSGYSHLQHQHTQSDVLDRRLLVRVNSEVEQWGHQETQLMGLSRVNSDMGAARSIEPRPYSSKLGVAIMENNNRASEFVEKEKRTPKANQFYRNSEFLLGKDRLPSESNKRLKTSNGRKHRGDADHRFGFGFGSEKNRNQVFKNCGNLLERLMKHKHGWVFNEPVNAKAMRLVDYHDIIKHPMDLGTIKTRLSQNWYKSPTDFADDVRLVFSNAMTYNPKGQDVHIMAEQLSQIFEERWAIIESEYNSDWKHQIYHDGRLPTPTSRRAPPQSHFGPTSGTMSLYVPPAPQMRTIDRPEPVVTPIAVDPKIQRPHVGRTPVPKKPKAKDLNKRDMTYEEKQRLSTNLQGLPSEKLDAIVQIIKRRNTALSQHDDEIEVDIDSVDTETLWELDRFVTNYRKSLSKNKRKAELALQARTVANQNVAPTNSVPAVADQIRSGAAFEKSTVLPAEGEKRGYNGSRSSSSSSSSSDSGSSSSDSDSDSSSADGSDAGHSLKS